MIQTLDAGTMGDAKVFPGRDFAEIGMTEGTYDFHNS
jgi:hypothetical protein